MDLFKEIERQEHEARSFGFYWETIEQLVEQIQSECKEIQETFPKQNQKELQEEVGDLLLAAISLSLFCGINPKAALAESIQKFQKRYDKLVDLVQKDGRNDLLGVSSKEQLKYWVQAKKENTLLKKVE